LENPMKLGHVRKGIARIKTILRDRQLNTSTGKSAQAMLKGRQVEQPK
jgi:hypothetical protein